MIKQDSVRYDVSSLALCALISIRKVISAHVKVSGTKEYQQIERACRRWDDLRREDGISNWEVLISRPSDGQCS
jgi:hypothetical protein